MNFRRGRAISLPEAHVAHHDRTRGKMALEPGHDGQADHDQPGQANGGEIEIHADQDPDCGRGPDRRGRRQAAHVESGLHDDARAQEADASQDRTDHAGRVACPVLARHAPVPQRGIACEQGDRTRGRADKAIDLGTRGAAVEVALVADQPPERQGAGHVRQHRQAGQVKDLAQDRTRVMSARHRGRRSQRPAWRPPTARRCAHR